MSSVSDKRPGRIPIGTRPPANPQAEAWIRQRDGSDVHKGDLYTERLTLDITPTLRARIKVAAFTQNTTVRARLILAVLSACGFAALAWASFVQPAVHIVYSPSDSVWVGWYRITPASASPLSVLVGSIVLVRLSADAAALAAQRGYLPARIPLLKRVGTVAPHVCIKNRELRIDGVTVAALLPANRMGRSLQSWPHCRRRTVLAERDQPSVVRQPLLRADPGIRGDRHRPADVSGVTAVTAAWRALTHWQNAFCAAPPKHRVHVLAGRGRMQGKIKGHDTAWRESPVCTWG